MYPNALQKKIESKKPVKVGSILISWIWHTASHGVVAKKNAWYLIHYGRTCVTESPFYKTISWSITTAVSKLLQWFASHQFFPPKLIKRPNDCMEISPCHLMWSTWRFYSILGCILHPNAAKTNSKPSDAYLKKIRIALSEYPRCTASKYIHDLLSKEERKEGTLKNFNVKW